jgi:GH35 family endo-1,4-beta-xylanase
VTLCSNNALPNKIWSPAQFRSVLTRFTQLGLEVHLTEFDVVPTDPVVVGATDPARALADIYTGVIRVCLEFAACKCVSTWGFTDAYNRWGTDGNTFYYDTNYIPKLPRTLVAQLLASTHN